MHLCRLSEDSLSLFQKPSLRRYISSVSAISLPLIRMTDYLALHLYLADWALDAFIVLENLQAIDTLQATLISAGSSST